MSTLAGDGVHPPSSEGWQLHLDRRRRPSTGALRRALARGTVVSVAERSLTARAGRVLLDVDGRSATGGDLLAYSDVVATRLAHRGARRGERVLLCVPTSLEFVAAYLGVLRAGCSAVLANPVLTYPELHRLLDADGPACGIVSTEVAETLGDLVVPGSVRDIGPELKLVGLAGPATSARSREGPPEPGDEAVLANTSGSTGVPKGVPLSHANLLSSIRAAMAAWRWSRDDVVVHTLPLHHQHGLGSIHALLLGGGRTVIRSRFDPEELAALISSERASVLLAVPAIYRRLLESSPRREQFASLRLAVSGSGPLPPALFSEIEVLTGQAPLERYGMTESGLDVSNLYNGARRSGSVGYALPGVEVVVGDPDSGEELSPGSDGEILMRGPQVFSGYLGSDGAGEGAFTADGWLRSGDVGRVDPEDGSLSITGRSKDVIISGGLNVYPREVEVVLEQHHSVAAVAVGGVRSERWGETVCAFVVPRRGEHPMLEELVALCHSSLAPYKRPKQFFLVEELPRNYMGKVLRNALAPLAESGELLK